MQSYFEVSSGSGFLFILQFSKNHSKFDPDSGSNFEIYLKHVCGAFFQQEVALGTMINLPQNIYFQVINIIQI